MPVGGPSSGITTLLSCQVSSVQCGAQGFRWLKTCALKTNHRYSIILILKLSTFNSYCKYVYVLARCVLNPGKTAPTLFHLWLNSNMPIIAPPLMLARQLASINREVEFH